MGSSNDLYEPGTVVVLKDNHHAVYLGATDRGLHALAVTPTCWAAYYTDPDTGDRPNLRRAVWTPRKVKASTIVQSLAEQHAAHQAQLQARAAADAEREAESQALRRLSDALAAFIETEAAGTDIVAYGYNHGEVRFYGGTADEYDRLTRTVEDITAARAQQRETVDA